MKPMKVLSVKSSPSNIFFTVSTEKSVYMTRLAFALKVSLLPSI